MTTQSQASAAADVAEALPTNETPPEPIQVELPAEETPEPAAAVTPPAGPPKKKVGRQINERIGVLTSDKKNLMAELEVERQRSAKLTETLQAREAELTQGQVRQMELHKLRLTSDAERARQDYEAAFNAQDPRKQADATAKLARSESGLADVEAWEARNKIEKPAEPKPEPQQQFQPPPQLDPATSGWMDENPWFQPLINGKHNPDFDRSMHLTAVAYASRLEDRMKAEGRSKDVAGAEYWGEINQYMAKEFPDRYEAPEEGEEVVTPPAATPAHHRQVGSPVAPAARSLPANKTAPAGKVLAQLSGQERAMADNLRNSGALVYPANHPKVQANPKLRGERMTPEDSYIAYGVQIRRDKVDQIQRRANQ